MNTCTKGFAGIVLITTLSALIGCSKPETGTATSATSSSDAVADSFAKRYDIKSGIVHYEPMDMMGLKITQTLYFDDYGHKEAKEIVTESDFLGKKAIEHKMEIMDGDYEIAYQVKKTVNGKDETSKEATKKDMGQFRELGQMIAANASEEMKKNFDYREEGTEQVAGVTGTKYSIALNKEAPDARIYGVIYKNITLKSGMNGMNIVASRIEENASVPASKFQIPSGYSVKEINLGN